MVKFHQQLQRRHKRGKISFSFLLHFTIVCTDEMFCRSSSSEDSSEDEKPAPKPATPAKPVAAKPPVKAPAKAVKKDDSDDSDSSDSDGKYTICLVKIT